MSALIASDENLFVRHMQAGWPGCAHDDRMLSHCDLLKNKNKHFKPMEHLLKDSAFSPNDFFVPVYKKNSWP